MPSTFRGFSEDVPQVFAALTLESRLGNNVAAWTTERDRLALEEPGIAGAAGVTGVDRGPSLFRVDRESAVHVILDPR